MRKLGLLMAIAAAIVLIPLVVAGCTCDGGGDSSAGSEPAPEGASGEGLESAGEGVSGSAPQGLSTEEALVYTFYGPFGLDATRWVDTSWTDDWRLDLFYSISSTGAGITPAEADMVGVFGAIFDLAPEASKAAFGNTVYECGVEVDGMLTVCPDGAGEVPSGELAALAVVMDGDIPLDDPDKFYTYAAVFDSDGDTGNNFQYFDPYDWDLYQGTDLWYELNWNPDIGQWQLTASSWDGNMPAPVATSARAVLDGQIVAFFIPVSEFAVPRPGYRVTAFAHDGTYAPEASGGDVNGADPTEPLAQLPENAISIETVTDE